MEIFLIFKSEIIFDWNNFTTFFYKNKKNKIFIKYLKFWREKLKSDTIWNFWAGSLLLKGGKICIGRRGAHVVEERQMSWDVLGCPRREVSVEKSLIAAVKRSLGSSKVHQLFESLLGGAEHEDAGVEAIRPSGIGGGRQLFALEELITVFHHLNPKFPSNFDSILICFTRLPSCRHQGRRTFRIESSTSNGVLWRWSRAPGARARPGWLRPRCQERKHRRPRQTSAPIVLWKSKSKWIENPIQTLSAYLIGGLSPSLVTMMTIFLVVPLRRSELAKTRAPSA